MAFTHEFNLGDKATLARPEGATTLAVGTHVTITRVDVIARLAHTGTPYGVEVKAPDGSLHTGLGREFDPR